MSRAKTSLPKPFTVLCQWHPGIDACDPWETVVVKLAVVGNAEDAANEACLYLLWKRMGQAAASMVIEGHPKIHVPDVAVFDAEEYGEVVTFGATIMSAHNYPKDE